MGCSLFGNIPEVAPDSGSYTKVFLVDRRKGDTQESMSATQNTQNAKGMHWFSTYHYESFGSQWYTGVYM